MEVLFEVLKYTIPALVVFATVYYMFRQYIDGQLRLKGMEIQQKKGERNLPVRMQAYERLALLCERIRVTNLFYRLNQKSLHRESLAQAMLVSVQKEFEHNLSQQIYVSDNLWAIIVLAKDETIAIINESMTEEGDYFLALNRRNQMRQSDPIDQALTAIRKEAAFYLS